MIFKDLVPFTIQKFKTASFHDTEFSETLNISLNIIEKIDHDN